MANQPAGEMYRAHTPALSPRLQAAAGLVRAGGCAADIGCDHGKLAVYLVKSGRCQGVIAVDIRPMPLAKARALAAQAGCASLVDCRLGDGLAVVEPAEVQDVIIAGVSGETAVEILRAAPGFWQAGKQFVFVPATRAERLRAFLWQNGFSILQEVPIEDAGRDYTAVLAAFTGEVIQPAPLQCELGLLPPDSEITRRMLHRRVQHMQRQLLAPMDDAERRVLEQTISEVQECPDLKR